MQNTNRLDNVICLTNMSTNVIASDHRNANPNADLRNVKNVNSSLLGNYKLDILGISECRWTGSGKMNTKNDKGESYTIIHSDQKDTHHRGVALIMNRESANTLMEW